MTKKIADNGEMELSGFIEPPLVPEGDYFFPETFLWGSSSSAYQVEGGIKNDWSEWEKSEARLAALEREGKDKDDYICGQAVDHYERASADIALAKDLGNNAIRIGLEWARIQPAEDTWDATAINHYRELLREAKAKGLTTAVTLWHWTNPLWLTEQGGWTNKKVIQYFEAYTEVIIRELGAEIDLWLTLNEPLVHVSNGYLKGEFPPAKHNPYLAEKVFRHLGRAHKAAYKRIHAHFPKAQVSITGLINHFEPASEFNLIELAIASFSHYFWNHRFLAKIRKQMDFIGLDYYFHDRIVWYPPFHKNKNERVTDLNWEIYPEGILEVLRYLQGFKKPIYIMENGLADSEDKYRANFIKEHLYYIHTAISEGIDVCGYFHWSLLDNFEWAKGWTAKFGLYEVDRQTFARIERPSAAVYRQICQANGFRISQD